MQEEVEQKTMALSVRTARLTAELLQKAFRQFFEAQKNKPQEFKQGKQTLKELMKQNTNISSIEITHDNIKDFEGTAKKYGIDFALKKDISENPPTCSEHCTALFANSDEKNSKNHPHIFPHLIEKRRIIIYNDSVGIVVLKLSVYAWLSVLLSS